MIDEALKACPFCGSEDLVVELKGRADEDWHRVACLFDACCADGPLLQGREQAVEAWNKRSEPA